MSQIRPFRGGMAQTLRSGAKSDERADVAMPDHEPSSRKEQILLDIQNILDVDEEVGGHLDGYLKKTLLAVEKLMDYELRSWGAGGPDLQRTLSKIENRLSTIEKQNANQPSRAET